MLYGVVTFGNQVFQSSDLLIKFQSFSQDLIDQMNGITANPSETLADEGMQLCIAIYSIIHEIHFFKKQYNKNTRFILHFAQNLIINGE